METAPLIKAILIRIVLYGAILFFVFTWIFSGLLLRAYRPDTAYTPAMFNIKFNEVILKTSDNIEAPAWEIPAKTAGNKWIILCHGLGADRSDMLNYIPLLHRKGYNLLALDFRGHGANKYKYTSLGYNEVKDLLGAVEFAKANGAKSIGVLGRSMGGATALMGAGLCADINAVVSDSSFATLNSMIRHYARRFYHVPYFPLVPAAVFLAEIRSGFKYREVNPAVSISKVKTPVLIIHGEADENIPVENAKLIYAAAAGPKKLLLFPGARHVEALSTDTKTYEKEVQGFFGEYLK